MAMEELNDAQRKTCGYDTPVLTPSKIDEIKQLVTYGDFIRDDVDAVVAPFRGQHSIWRKAADIAFRSSHQ